MKKSTVNLLIRLVIAGITFCIVAIFAVKADARTGTFGYSQHDKIQKEAKLPTFNRLSFPVNHE